MNYKKLQIVPSKRRYLRISATGKSIPDHRVHCEKFILFVVYGFKGSGEFQASGVKKTGSVKSSQYFFNALGATARDASVPAAVASRTGLFQEITSQSWGFGQDVPPI